MSRLTSLKRLVIAVFATGGVIVACRAAQPAEAPPLAPRPGQIDGTGPTGGAPVPGAPDPIGPTTTGDAGTPSTPSPTTGAVSSLDPPIYRADGMASDAGTSASDGGRGDGGGRDAGARDGGTLDAGVDAMRLDASPPDATPPDASALDAAPAPPPRDARVPDARDGGVSLPPNPDAHFPSDAARPM